MVCGAGRGAARPSLPPVGRLPPSSLRSPGCGRGARAARCARGRRPPGLCPHSRAWGPPIRAGSGSLIGRPPLCCGRPRFAWSPPSLGSGRAVRRLASRALRPAFGGSPVAQPGGGRCPPAALFPGSAPSPGAAARPAGRALVGVAAPRREGDACPLPLLSGCSGRPRLPPGLPPAPAAPRWGARGEREPCQGLRPPRPLGAGPPGPPSNRFRAAPSACLLILPGGQGSSRAHPCGCGLDAPGEMEASAARSRKDKEDIT